MERRRNSHSNIKFWYEIGDEYADEIKLASFGRRAVLSLRQTLASRILDLEKASLYEKYSEKVGEIVTGEVYQVWKKEVLILDDEENELILPKAEQLPNDFYRKGDTIKAIVKSDFSRDYATIRLYPQWSIPGGFPRGKTGAKSFGKGVFADEKACLFGPGPVRDGGGFQRLRRQV